MGARTGAQYTEGLRDGRQIYVNGKLVSDVTQYPPFQGVIRTLARLYDCQHEPAYRNCLTYSSPTSGDPVSTSFLPAKSSDEMHQRVEGERLRCELTYGLMGRLPDFMNAFVTDMASVRTLLSRRDSKFGDNAWNYYETCRERDLCLTHTLVDPQVDRSKSVDAQGSLRIVRETGAGLIVRGARMLSTLAPVSHELWVGPYSPRKAGEEQYALSFAIPVATAGLKFACRAPYDTGRSTFDRPLSSRFDEGDALAIFDDVRVPWERVFVAGDIETYNLLLPAFPGYLMLQGVIRGAAKLRFLTGLAGLVAESVGRTQVPRYQEMLGELVGLVELAEGLVEATADQVTWKANHPMVSQNDVLASTANNLGNVRTSRGFLGLAAIQMFFPEAINRAANTIRMAGSSGLIMTPTEQDLTRSELREELELYMKGAQTSAEERLRIMKLAWDAIGTEFGSRQSMYESFYAGDPINNRIRYYGSARYGECVALTRRLLETS
jgi:4-hydroxyphenylacetate 3-monooxygenase oxygenase component